MPYDPNKHHRRSIRLQGYDYSQAGAYFVTMCTQNRELLFVADEVVDMIQRWWNKLPEKFPGVETDAFVIMPNHSHGIIVTVGVNPRVDSGQTREYGQTHGSAPTNPAPTNDAPTNDAPTLGTIIQWFKTMTTNEYIRGVKELNWPPFPGKLWQRNYYEHIIRNDRELNAIRQYIIDNPAKWEQDRDNPIHIRPAIDTVAVYLREAGL
jgi:putative transposase